MENVKYSGLWWLPSNPDRKVAGTLTFSNLDGIELSLIGSLETSLVEGFGNVYHTHPVILGLTADGKRITLGGCRAAGLSVGFPGFMTRGYRVRLCFVGGHLSEEQLQFKKVIVRYSRLPDWVRTSGLTVTKYEDDPHRLDLSYSLPDEVEAITDRGKVSIDFSFNTAGDPLDEVRLRQSVSLVIEADHEYDFGGLMVRFIRPFQNFLSLATARPNSILDVEVYSEHVRIVTLGGSVGSETPVHVIFQQRHSEAKPDKTLIPDDMLFTLHDAGDNFQGMVGRWLGLSEELDSVCNLFFGVQYTPDMYPENQFLNIAQAVESYHRRRFNNHVLPKAEHRARKREIISTVDARHREWLEGILAYSNEPRLEHRVRELVASVHETLSPLIPVAEDFARRVKDTRNYYTHYDKRLTEKAAKGADLFWLTRQLSYLLQACMLNELGFTAERSAQLFNRNQSFVHAINQLSK
jgi:hypothetical protein